MSLHTLTEIIDQLTLDTESLDHLILVIDFERFKLVIAEMLNRMYKDSSDRFMATRFPHMDTYTAMALKHMSVFIMGKMTQEAVNAVAREGPREAIRTLEDFQHSKMDDVLLSESTECINYSISLNENMVFVLKVLSRLAGYGEKPSDSDYNMRWKDIEPDKCSEYLSPLVNPHRITLAQLLHVREASFQELSAATGLKTGHLQFHLNSLIENGYVIRVSKGTYSLTKMGCVALNSLADFYRHVRMQRTIKDIYRPEPEN